MLSLNPDCLSFGKQDGTHPDEGRPGNRVDLAVMFASHVRTCTRFAMEMCVVGATRAEGFFYSFTCSRNLCGGATLKSSTGSPPGICVVEQR